MLWRNFIGDAHMRLKARLATYRDRLALVRDRALVQFRAADIAIFHAFSPPPGGGGHQFMRALWGELERRGLRVENNTISHTTQACLFNSFNFDFKRLRRLHRDGCKLVHRVDGPIGVYRGWDDGSDRRIWQINQEIADVTIFQSQYSLQKHLELGLKCRSPHIIINAADPTIFHSQGRRTFNRQDKIRLISASWSDNPNKGAATYQWIEDNLDWDRFEYTFVGRSAISFKRIHTLPPVPSEQLAQLLRQHDIYITASQHDPCSNGLIEALSCGLPALYLKSGGHPEIVGEAGLGFFTPEDIPAGLTRLVDEYETRQQSISLPSLAEICDRYLAVMDISPAEGTE